MIGNSIIIINSLSLLPLTHLFVHFFYFYRGYLGPGGISEHSKYKGCTGGIHRYVDIQMFTNKLIYHHPTCLNLYDCQLVLDFF